MFWLIGIVALFLLAGLGGYLLRKHEVGRKAAMRDLRRGLPLMAMGLVVGYGLMRLLPVSGFDLLLIAGFPILIGYGLWRRRQAGSVLMNLGRSSRHKMFLGIGVLLILLSIVELVSSFVENGTDAVDVSSIVWGLSFGVFFLFMGLSGLEIREAGIFSDGQLLNWERIESYEWGEKALTVRLKRWWFKTVSFPVPRLHRDAVSDLLAQHISGATVEPGRQPDGTE